MENFVVSARKYRPSTFDTVVGQKSITNTLKNAIRNNHLAQAFLFCGPRGVGKTTCARILAKTINCQNLTENVEACNTCPSCVNFNNSSSFNVYELDAASNNSVEDIRSLVEQVRIPPQGAKYKVYIIDEVHMLSTAAFNAFLKTLEEPPAYAKFILATTEKHKILPTILSRCQIFDFKRITIEDIAGHLADIAKKENIEADTDALHIIAQKADGALRDALSIFDQIVSFTASKIDYKSVLENLNVLDYDYYFKLTDHFLNGNITDSLLILDDIFQKGFDGQHFVTGLGEHLRSLLVCKDIQTIKLLEVGNSIKEKYKTQAQIASPLFLLKALEAVNRADNQYKGSSNKRLLIELTLLQLCSLNQSGQSAQMPVNSQKTLVENPTQVKPEVSKPIVQTPVQSQPMSGISGKKLDLGTSSIKSIQNDNDKKKIESGIEGIESAEKPNIFSQNDLEQVWKVFIQRIEKQNASLHNTFSRNFPKLTENFIVEIKLDNTIQKDDPIFAEKQLIRFLRQELKNNKIDFKIIIESNESSIKPYTDRQKFESMARENPAILELKSKLDLELY